LSADGFLRGLVVDFAEGLVAADAKRPQASNQRSGEVFQAGIGPHTENRTIDLVFREIGVAHPHRYTQVRTAVPYPSDPRQRCDVALQWDGVWWFLEVKLLRLLDDNGKPNDNMLMHILSPYRQHRSAVTDCQKLVASGFSGHKAILIFGYDYADWPLVPAIEAFERLAGLRPGLGSRWDAAFSGLCHPVHRAGAVYAWELLDAGPGNSKP
jgi:hypothetical protein